MSLLKKLLRENNGFFVPYNAGTYNSINESDLAITKDYYTNNSGDFGLQNRGLKTAKTASLYTTTAYNLGTSDFTIFFRIDIIERYASYNYIFGLNIVAPNILVYLNNSTNQLRIRLGNIVSSPTTVLNVNGSNVVAVVFNRNGNANFYLDGKYDSSLSISSEVSTDLNIYLGMFNMPSGLKHYEGLIKKALTATEIATITAELENGAPDLRAWDPAQSDTPFSVQGDGSAIWLNTGINSFATGAFEFEFIWDGTSDIMFIGSDTSSPDRLYVGVTASRLAGGYGTQNWGVIVGTTTLIAGRAYKGRFEFGVTNKLYLDGALEYSGASSGVPSVSNIAILAGDVFGNFKTSSKMWNVKIENSSGNVIANYPMQQSLADYSGNDNHASNAGSKDALFVYGEIFDIPFKGEMHALANEVVSTSGYLENTGVKVESGSAKLITEDSFSTECRKIECVTNCDLLMPMGTDSLSGWNRYIDDVLVTSDLAVARTISLTAGEKLIWSSKNHLYDLYQEV